jgi:hypothetical protein
VDEAVEDGVGDRGIAERLVPVGNGELAGHDRGTGAGAILDDLEQVGGTGSWHRLEAEVVEYEDVDAGPRSEQPWESPIGPREHKLLIIQGMVGSPGSRVGRLRALAIHRRRGSPKSGDIPLGSMSRLSTRCAVQVGRLRSSASLEPERP